MTIRLSKRPFAVLGAGLVAAAVAGVMPAGAQGQSGQPSSGARQQGGSLPAEWFKVCSEQGGNEICNTQYTLIADTRQLITAVNLIDVQGEVTQKVIQAVVPTGRVVPAGVQIKVDTGDPQTLNYSVCFPDRCIAEAELTDDMINRMKRGGQMTVTSINFQRQANPVNISLSGFTNAIEGEPRSQSEIAQRQQELGEALQQRAEERQRRFEEAQDAAKDGDGASE